jgi:hypothetical protein
LGFLNKGVSSSVARLVTHVSRLLAVLIWPVMASKVS